MPWVSWRGMSPTLGFHKIPLRNVILPYQSSLPFKKKLQLISFLVFICPFIYSLNTCIWNQWQAVQSTGNTGHKKLQRLETFWRWSVRKGSLEEVKIWEIRRCYPDAVWDTLWRALEGVPSLVSCLPETENQVKRARQLPMIWLRNSVEWLLLSVQMDEIDFKFQ